MSKLDKKAFLKEIDASLDDIRPHLAVDGGNVEVVDLTDDMTVMIKWLGNCSNCTMSGMTMVAGVAQTIKSRFPEIRGVEAVNGLAQ